MRFIRVHGRVVPIKDNAPQEHGTRGTIRKAAKGVGAAGAALIAGGAASAAHAGAKMHKNFQLSAGGAQVFGMQSAFYQKHKALTRAAGKNLLRSVGAMKVGAYGAATGLGTLAALRLTQGKKKK